MAKKIPTIDELREYLDKEEAYLKECLENKTTYVISGPKFPGESIWKSKSTLPLLIAAEEVGTSREEIWKLCSKLTSTTHAPISKKDYERMLPFAEKTAVVDAVLKFLETYRPEFSDINWSLKFDIKAYYYCIAIISQSSHRREDCEKQLWDLVHYHASNDEKKGELLLRNMKVLEANYPNIVPMKNFLLEAQNS